MQQKIFEYFLEQHNLTLLEGEINDIEHLINTELMKELSNVYMELNTANTAAAANLNLQQMQEKELEETVKQYNAVIEQNRQLQQKLRETTAECEELRSELKNEKTAYENEIEIYNQACLDLQEELEESISECKKLKKAAFTLAEGLNFRQKMPDEIENFAKRHCNSCEDNGQQLCSSNYCYRHYLLDIISKAKEAENDG